MRIQVKDFMSSPVITAVNTTTVAELRVIMSEKHIHGIPIIEVTRQLPQNEIKILGIVTAKDLGLGVDPDDMADKVMTPNLHVVHKDSSANAAAKLMLRHGCHHLVAMEDGGIVGMVSSLDFVRLVSEHTLD